MLAPELQVERWLNTHEALTLSTLRGRVVLMVAFQTHCTGCTMFAIPQLRRMSESLDPTHVAVLGLHTPFERSTSAEALATFVAQHRLACPVAIDRLGGLRVPMTLRAYEMQGTPTTVLVDRVGHLRMVHFGIIDDDSLEAHVALLVGERVG